LGSILRSLFAVRSTDYSDNKGAAETEKKQNTAPVNEMPPTRLLDDHEKNTAAEYGSIHTVDDDIGITSSSSSVGHFVDTGSVSRRSLGDSMASLSSSLRGGLRDSLVFSGGSRCSIRDLSGNSTMSKSSFNLIKNLVGAGVLALPSGV
jgi:hypothetical protein